MGWWYTFAIEHDWLFQPCYYLDEVADSLAFLSIVEFGWWCFHWGEHGSMYEQQLFSTAILEELASYIQSLDCEVCKETYANWMITYCMCNRYIFIPLGGSKYFMYNMWPVFTFVALWHDIELKLLAWGWLICLFLLPEIIASSLFTYKKVS